METTRCSTGSFSPSDLVLSSLSRYEGSCCVTVFAHLFHSSCHCIHFILHPHLCVPLRRILEVLLIKISLSVFFIFYLFIFYLFFFGGTQFYVFYVFILLLLFDTLLLPCAFAFFSTIPLLHSAPFIGPAFFKMCLYSISCILFSPVHLHLSSIVQDL